MSLSLSKNQTVGVPRSAGHVVIGTGWESTPPSRVDLDLAAYVYSESHELLERIYFANLASTSGAIVASGDNVSGDGDGDDESIALDLDALWGESHVHSVAFVLTSFSGHAFAEVEESYVRLLLCAGDAESEVARMTLHGHPDSADVTVMSLCHLVRFHAAESNQDAPRWVLHTLGTPLETSQADLAAALAAALESFDHAALDALDVADLVTVGTDAVEPPKEMDAQADAEAESIGLTLDALIVALDEMTSAARALKAGGGGGGNAELAAAVEGLETRTTSARERLELLRESAVADQELADRERAELEETKARLEADADALQQQLAELSANQGDAEALAAAVDALDDEVEALEEANRALAQRVEEAKAAAAAAAGEAQAAAETQRQALAQRKAELEAETAALEAEEAALLASRSDNSVEQDRLSAEAEALTSEAQALRARRSELEVRKSSSEREAAATKALAATVAAVRSDADALRSEVAALEDRLREAGGRSSESSASLNEELEMLSSETLALHRTKRQIEEQLTRASTRSAQLREAETLVAAHKEGNANLRAQIEALEAELVPKETAVQMLEHEVALQAAVVSEERAELDAALRSTTDRAAAVHARYLDTARSQAETLRLRRGGSPELAAAPAARVAAASLLPPGGASLGSPVQETAQAGPSGEAGALLESLRHELAAARGSAMFTRRLQDALEALLDAAVAADVEPDTLRDALPLLFRGVDHILSIVAATTNTVAADNHVRGAFDDARALAATNMAVAEAGLGAALDARRAHLSPTAAQPPTTDPGTAAQAAPYAEFPQPMRYVGAPALGSSPAHSQRAHAVFASAPAAYQAHLTPSSIHTALNGRFMSGSPPPPPHSSLLSSLIT